MPSTVKRRTTLQVDNEFKKEDKKKINTIKKEMKKCDLQLRNLRKNVGGLSFISSTDLTKLDRATDDFGKAWKDLISLFNEKLHPENWQEKK